MSISYRGALDPFQIMHHLAGPFFLVTALTHLLFAIGVFRDAVKLRNSLPPRETVLVGPVIWSLATLIGGPLMAAVYWALNRSTLRPPGPTEP